MENRLQTRILLITHFLPPSHTAGTEQYTLGLGKALQAKGYNVTIICAEDWDTGKAYWNGITEEKLDGVLVYRVHLNWLKARNPNRKLYESLIVEKWLNQFLIDNTFDLVHVTSTYSLGVGVLRSVKRAKIPLVLTLMDFWFLCPSIQLLRSDESLCDGKTSAWQCDSCLMANSHLYSNVYKILGSEELNAKVWGTLSHITLMSRQRGMRGMLLNMDHRKKILTETFDLPDVVISPSRTVKSVFAKNMSRTIELLPYGNDISWLGGYKGKTVSPKIRIGYLGQIEKVKGVHVLVEAFTKAQLGEKATLDIWGDYSRNPDYTQELLKLMDQNQSIKMHGKYIRDQLHTILSSIDILVVPSLWYENAPLVIQEAFATKTLVIATNLGGMRETIEHNVNGLLFERGDSNDLAKLLKRMIDEKGLLDKLTDSIPPVRTFQDELVELEAMYERLILENQSVRM